MIAKLLPPGEDLRCEPLTCTRALADIPVANRPLGTVIRERIEALEGAALIQRIDCWLSDASLQALAAEPVAALVLDGEEVAWVSPDGELPYTDRQIQADDDCFRIRYAWDVLRVNELLVGALTESVIEGELSDRATVDGVLVLGEGSRVLPGVYIEGNAIIGRNCKIGPNCYLRGNTAIGDHCHIGQAVEIKNTLLMDHVGMGHLSYCGDSIVGAGTNFGAGTITANFRHDGRNHRSMVEGELVDTGRRKLGSIIGDDVHTGIHTSIYPGRKLWPHTSTRPGDVIQRDLTE
jgi:bifunctional UDP-N-acetylglucosamine pyrophosphorylase/glucosamine-1-phosphate N-acetyltransferase